MGIYTVTMQGSPNVPTRYKTLSFYVSSMWMGEAHITTARRVQNYYSLPKADKAEITMSAHVRNDETLCQSTTLEWKGTKI